jgi:polar amino acid transport system substrate-binding protein
MRRCLATALLFSVYLPGLAMAACEKTLRWDDDPPFSMELPDGSIGGMYVDANRAALERLDCVVTMRKLPWARALKELELGRLDILPGAFRRPEREVYAYFSGVVLPHSRNLLFVHQDAFEHQPITRLIELQHTPFRLGAQTNVHYGPDYELLMRDPTYAYRVAMVTNRTNLWNMIAKRRIDGAIADEHTGAYEIQQLGLSDTIKATNVVVSSGDAEIAFSRRTNTPEFVMQYAETMRALVTDGSYAQIVQRYIAH